MQALVAARGVGPESPDGGHRWAIGGLGCGLSRLPPGRSVNGHRRVRHAHMYADRRARPSRPGIEKCVGVKIECTASLGHKLRPPRVNSGRSALSSWTLVDVGERLGLLPSCSCGFDSRHPLDYVYARVRPQIFALLIIEHRASTPHVPKVMTGPVRLGRGWAEGRSCSVIR